LTAGDIIKEALLVIEEYTVKLNEDIERGELVYNDGNGILAATAGSYGPFMVALEDHDYSEENDHKVRCISRGCVKVQKKTGNAVKQGQYIKVSSTTGEADIWDYTTPGNWFDVAGVAAEDVASGASELAVWVGKR